MIQFTEEERKELKRRAERRPEVIGRLKEDVRDVMERPVTVPKEGIADWTMYFYCPKCSVQLAFDPDSPHAHRCPACGTVYTGAPYDGAWWGLVNAGNYNAAHEMGLIYAATGENAYARKCVQILLAYAKYYPDYQVHGNIPYNGPGRSGAQTLDEANFLRSLAMAFDLAGEIMTQEEREYVCERMLLPGAEFLMEHRHRQLHNHEVIISSAIAAVGIVLQREEYIRFALEGRYGIYYQLDHAVLEDGFWFEESVGYHFFTLSNLMEYEKLARHTPYTTLSHPS